MNRKARVRSFGIGDRVQLKHDRDFSEPGTVVNLAEPDVYGVESDTGYQFRAREDELVRLEEAKDGLRCAEIQGR